MKQFILASIFIIIGVAWPTPVLQARGDCGGSHSDIGFGGNIMPFEIPPVDEVVRIGEFTLKVNRVQWSIQAIPAGPVAAIFNSKDTSIRALRLPPLRPSQTLNDLASSAPLPSSNCSVRLENIRTSFAIPGVKATYGGRPNFMSQNIRLIRYYFLEKSGRVVCFEVLPKKKFPDCSGAAQLLLNTLNRGK